jgi:hypothetical protein
MSRCTGCPIARPVESTTGVRTPCTRGDSWQKRARTDSPYSILHHSALSASGPRSITGCSPLYHLSTAAIGIVCSVDDGGRTALRGVGGRDRPITLSPAAHLPSLLTNSRARKDDITIGIEARP